MRIFVAFIFVLIFMESSFTYSLHSNNITISIDCNKIDGEIKIFGDINAGPLPIHYVKNGVELTQQYNQIGINFVRTHDFYGPTDISNIFPDWNASVDDESSYNFTESDKVINSIINGGYHVFYRLGESANNNRLRQPPKNFTKWAEICKHLVMHYNDGWNNGYHYNIKYWEIWNEPDLKGFWNGTVYQYYKLYSITARILKSYNSSIKVGGPCTSSIYNENFTKKFLEYIVKNKVPIDFYSWHMYTSNPYEIYKASKYIRNLLDDYGLKNCENINSEWNIDILSPQRDKDNAKNAAFTACCLTLFQDANLSHAFRYRGTQDNNWLMKLLGFDLSLFTYDGKYKTPALVYLAMNYMKDNIRLSIHSNISNGITCLAGISKDKTNVSIILSNYEAKNSLCILNITNISNDYRFIHYLIDDSHHLQIIENKTFNGQIPIAVYHNSMHFIRLTNSKSIPKEGPSVASIPFLLRLPFLDPIFKIIGIILLFWLFG